ncbi:MAG TPA: IS3 family transposase [Candidatus Aphodousia faecipullorum]|nr:IS3 family transposase [Candidatus Aphodousia faecipullorum]
MLPAHYSSLSVTSCQCQWLLLVVEIGPTAPSWGGSTDEFILTAVKSFIKQSRGYTPGLVSCYRHLRKQDLSIDYKRLRRIMRDNGLYHRYHRKYVKTTGSEHQLSCVGNLLDRRFNDFGINEAWCGDITYIPTKEGGLYLASVIDLGTRRLVGYSFGSRMTQSLVVEALQKAYDNELPEQGCLFHSDRGSQYCSQTFQAMLQEYGFCCSMNRRAQCWDNAAAESFWATLKRETLPVTQCFNFRAEA